MPIATLTLNPAVDVTYEIERLRPDQKAHASATRFDPGGNGINVSRALKRLGEAARTFCPLAGETGQFLERLLQRHLDDPAFIRIPGETRINCTLVERVTAAQYEVSGIGPPLPGDRLEDILDAFVAHVGEKGFGVVTGSVPPGVAETAYRDLIHRIQSAGGHGILDAHGTLLRYGICAAPFLVKPNRYELERMVGRELAGLEEMAVEVRRLIREHGIVHICVSLGPEGALMNDGGTLWHARPPKVPVCSTVGAGDSMVGGLVAGFARGLEVPEILRMAVAASAGTVTQPGTELFAAEQVSTLMEEVEIHALE